MPAPFTAQTAFTALESSSTSGGGDLDWFIHEQTLGFTFEIEECKVVGSTGATTSSMSVEGHVGVNQYIFSSFQFSAAETRWHDLSGVGYDTSLGHITAGTGYVFTKTPGYYRRRAGLSDTGSGCTGNFSFVMDPAALDINSVLAYVKIYCSIPSNGGCEKFESWLINHTT